MNGCDQQKQLTDDDIKRLEGCRATRKILYQSLRKYLEHGVPGGPTAKARFEEFTWNTLNAIHAEEERIYGIDSLGDDEK